MSCACPTSQGIYTSAGYEKSYHAYRLSEETGDTMLLSTFPDRKGPGPSIAFFTTVPS